MRIRRYYLRTTTDYKPSKTTERKRRKIEHRIKKYGGGKHQDEIISLLVVDLLDTDGYLDDYFEDGYIGEILKYEEFNIEYAPDDGYTWIYNPPYEYIS